MLFTPVGALLAKPDPVHLMKPQTGLMEGKEGKQKEKRQSYTQSSLLFLSVWRKWIPTKYNATGMHHYTWPSPPLHSGWGEVGEEKWRKRYLTIDGYAQEGGERHPVTKQLLCQKTRRTTHACKDTHTNVGKVNKEEAEWKQECQNDVAEGVHSILTALTAHTHTHTGNAHKQSWLPEMGERDRECDHRKKLSSMSSLVSAAFSPSKLQGICPHRAASPELWLLALTCELMLKLSHCF